MFSGLVGDQLQALKIRLRDYFPAGYSPLEEPLNLSRRPAAACVKTCSSEGFGRFAKAARVAATFGCGGSKFLFMPRIIVALAALSIFVPLRTTFPVTCGGKFF